jgi:acyl carrier protein|tara:strand:- start:3300 stop:3569 length:270 start_codon:yes stop_codon:yes gene_type:complete
MKTTTKSQKERYILTVLGRIFREVFDNDSMEITYETNSDIIDDWDSVNHVKLVLSIEEEFDIRFDMEAVSYVTNIKKFVEVINRLLMEK